MSADAHYSLEQRTGESMLRIVLGTFIGLIGLIALIGLTGAYDKAALSAGGAAVCVLFLRAG